MRTSQYVEHAYWQACHIQLYSFPQEMPVFLHFLPVQMLSFSMRKWWWWIESSPRRPAYLTHLINNIFIKVCVFLKCIIILILCRYFISSCNMSLMFPWDSIFWGQLSQSALFLKNENTWTVFSCSTFSFNFSQKQHRLLPLQSPHSSWLQFFLEMFSNKSIMRMFKIPGILKDHS